MAAPVQRCTLADLMPDEPEVHGLLALMLLLDARREARFRGDELVLLADQDGSRWNAEQLEDGRRVLGRAFALRGPGPYVVQAAIAALHADEPRDWSQIAASTASSSASLPRRSSS
jgi:RNA polymerase sigma-70 factor, ECF subfamily